MTEPAELFAKLIYQFEDLHFLAGEGRSAGQSTELLLILAGQIGVGLQHCSSILAEITTSVRAV